MTSAIARMIWSPVLWAIRLFLRLTAAIMTLCVFSLLGPIGMAFGLYALFCILEMDD